MGRDVLRPRALLLPLIALVACTPPSALPPVPPLAPASVPAPAALTTLTEAQPTAGFVAKALYVDDDGRPRGARFVHERTRFVFDYLAIESAPQAYVYA